MIHHFIKWILTALLIFTPVAFGSFEWWAFSLMELGILLILFLWSFQSLVSRASPLTSPLHFPFEMVLLTLFLLFILFQMIPLPLKVLQFLSPKTYALKQMVMMIPSSLRDSLSLPFLPSSCTLSLVPFATQVEFFKWLTLSGLFFFLLYWRISDRKPFHPFLPVMILVGVGESLYGIVEFFSGHKYILHLPFEEVVGSVTGTFINRNAFAGYLLMVIPLSVGFLISRKADQEGSRMDWRQRLISLDGKSLLIGFGIIVMILGLFLSGSRMGIASLLLSFTLIIFLFRNPSQERRFSRPSIFILGLAILWASWIGLDAVISRFFTSPEDLKMRMEIWKDTFQMAKDFPLFGSGLGTFLQVFHLYRSFPIRGLVTHSENDFLQLLSEVGLLGMGFLILLFFFLLLKTLSGIRTLSRREPGRPMAIGGLVGILALMFHSLVERNIQVPANAFLYTFLWAMVLRNGLPKKSPMTSSSNHRM